MNITAAMLPADWYLLGHFGLIGVLVWIVRTVSWRDLVERAQAHHFLGACVALFALWQLHPPALGGVELHLLGATAFTLMVGPQLAVLGLGLVLGGLVVTGHMDPAAYSLNALLLAVLPVLLSWGVLRAVERFLPRNIFVYIFAAAFFSAALAMGLSGSSMLGLVATFADPAQSSFAIQMLPFCLFLAFAEATLTGMVITILVVYRPEWVGTFDDDRYLRRS